MGNVGVAFPDKKEVPALKGVSFYPITRVRGEGMKNSVPNHIVEALRGAVAEAEGDEKLSRLLHAETKARLIQMSDEELWELAKRTSHSSQSRELVYKRYKQAREQLRATATEWAADLLLGKEG